MAASFFAQVSNESNRTPSNESVGCRYFCSAALAGTGWAIVISDQAKSLRGADDVPERGPTRSVGTTAAKSLAIIALPRTFMCVTP